jgi:hypothetical protein
MDSRHPPRGGRQGFRFGMLLVAAALIVPWPAAARAEPPVPLPPRRPVPFDAPPEPVPLPVPRPAFEAAAPPPQTGTSAATVVVVPAPMKTADDGCGSLMASGKLVATAVPAINGPGECGIAAPLRVDAIVLTGGGKVMLQPPAVMRCDLAATLADWVRDDIAPPIQRKGPALAGLEDAAAYDCRSRDHLAGAKLSEHGRGDAIDLRAFRLADGHELAFTGQAAADPVLTETRRTACERFMTVLGPGSDGYHKDHVHVDLEGRHNGAHYCQWNLPDPRDPKS